MSKRSEWVFVYKSDEVAAAAKARGEYHRGREGFWDQEYEAAVARAKEAGLQVREYQVTGGERAEVVIDPTLQGRITESYQKRAKHRGEAERYEMWVRVLSAEQQQHQLLELQADDVDYFFRENPGE